MSQIDREKIISDRFKKVYEFCMDYVLALQKPEVHNKYPDFPNGLPKELKYTFPSDKPKTKAIKKEPTEREQIEAKEFIGDVSINLDRSQRKTRFRGSLNLEKLEEKTLLFQRNRKVLDKSKVSQSTSQTLTVSKSSDKIKKEKSKIKNQSTLTDSSSSSLSSSSSASSSGDSSSSSDESSSSSEDEMKKPKTVDFKKAEFSKVLHLVPKPLNSVKIPMRTIQTSTKLNTTNGVSILKKLFKENNDNFDEAMKTFNGNKKLIPPVISPPKKDPMIKHKKKISKTNGNDSTISVISDGNEHLGGIFTIKNGWDKMEVEEEQIKSKNSNKDVNHNEEMIQHYDPVVNDWSMFNDKIQINVSPESSLSESKSTEYALKISDEEDDIGIKRSAKKMRKISSDDDDDDEIQKVIQNGDIKEIGSEKKADEEKEPCDIQIENSDNLDDCDTISLCADVGEFDDLYTELDDDCRMKIILNKPKPNEIKASEFDDNTLEIMKHIVDPETSKILCDVFGDVCPAFLEKKCSMPKCPKFHYLISINQARAAIQKLTPGLSETTYRVVRRFSLLLKTYIQIYAEMFAEYRDEQKLIDLVEACDRDVHTVECYKDIVNATVEKKLWMMHQAIKFIIKHHRDSPGARQIITEMIVDSGPYLTYNLDYIEQMFLDKYLTRPDFEKVLSNCVMFQNPRIPYFCLNYLSLCEPAFIARLNPEDLRQLLQMSKCSIQLNENHVREKLIYLTQKMSNM